MKNKLITFLTFMATSISCFGQQDFEKKTYIEINERADFYEVNGRYQIMSDNIFFCTSGFLIDAEFDTHTKDGIEYVSQFFIPINSARNSILEEQDKIPEYLYFINSGFMRLFYYDQNGEEQTTFLCSQNGFIASFSSLINQTKATENVECITDCELLKISFKDAKQLVDKSAIFKNFFLVMFEKSISLATLRANDLASLNADQRYQKMIDQQAHFIHNIPLQYIASYLGIKPQSLSRIRKQIINPSCSF
jgi:CRP/FNR family transcriptional regulator, anaerobic regulatory protein